MKYRFIVLCDVSSWKDSAGFMRQSMLQWSRFIGTSATLSAMRVAAATGQRTVSIYLNISQDGLPLSLGKAIQSVIYATCGPFIRLSQNGTHCVPN